MALTRSGTLYRSYVNGELADTEAGVGVLPDPVTTLAIGCTHEFWNGFLGGAVDEVTIYHRALAVDELVAVVAAGVDGKRLPEPTSSTTTTTTTTTSTSTSTTTSTSSTSTTLPATLCGDVDGNDSISATDALNVLQSAVGGHACEARPCVCDADGTNGIKSTDALIVLRLAVGFEIATACPC